MTKKLKIKGGVYSGYWRDFYTTVEAKKIGHKQERARAKKEIRYALV